MMRHARESELRECIIKGERRTRVDVYAHSGLVCIERLRSMVFCVRDVLCVIIDASL